MSLVGNTYYIQMMDSVFHVSGTSAATPSFAGMVALLNAGRLAKGDPVLGFLNPLLYAAHAADAGAFNDVVRGDNSCTEETCPCPAGTGFAAAPGWDAATGLGSINFDRLQAVIARLTAARR